MILQDLVQDNTQVLKVFLGKALKNSFQELIKNEAKSSQDLIGMYVQDLGKIYAIVKYDLTRSCARC